MAVKTQCGRSSREIINRLDCYTMLYCLWVVAHVMGVSFLVISGSLKVKILEVERGKKSKHPGKSFYYRERWHIYKPMLMILWLVWVFLVVAAIQTHLSCHPARPLHACWLWSYYGWCSGGLHNVALKPHWETQHPKSSAGWNKRGSSWNMFCDKLGIEINLSQFNVCVCTESGWCFSRSPAHPPLSVHAAAPAALLVADSLPLTGVEDLHFPRRQKKRVSHHYTRGLHLYHSDHTYDLRP